MPWSSRYSWTLRLEFLIPPSPNLDDKVFQILDSNEDHGRGNNISIISSFDTAWTSFPRSQRIRTVPSIFCTPLECFCNHTASMVQIARLRIQTRLSSQSRSFLSNSYRKSSGSSPFGRTGDRCTSCGSLHPLEEQLGFPSLSFSSRRSEPFLPSVTFIGK